MNITKSLVFLLWLGFHANILVLSGILCGSLYIQFVLEEFPCPLCMVQRISMLLCAVAQAYIISRIQADGHLKWRVFVLGEGLTLCIAITGASMSIRHILLHIVPPDPGYGSAFFGLHTYTWAFFTFVAEIAAVGINLLLAPRNLEQLRFDETRLFGFSPMFLLRFSRLVLYFLAIVIFAVAVATFIEEGLHWTLPDDPTRNELLYDLGFKLC